MSAMSQWDCVLQNLGEWQGSFTQISPEGEVIKDTPSIISLQGADDNRSIHLVLKRFYADSDQPHEMVIDFSAVGNGTLFFPSGAFSEGSTHFSTSLKFGAEFGFVHQDRRLRLVQIYGSGGQPSQFTLIREQRVGTKAPERTALSPAEWTGRWQGESMTLYPALTADKHEATVQSVNSIELEKGFEQAGVTYQITCLPDGAIATFPQQISTGSAFFMETGWLIQPNLRQRLVRQYSAEGQWINLSWVVERREEDSL